MKISSLLGSLIGLLPLSASSFEIPKASHNLAQLEKAAAKATKNNQPLTFLISTKKMTAT